MVDYRREGNVAILTVNNPPVNAISTRVKDGIYECISRAKNDTKVSVIVIHGHGKHFIAGADIHGFSGQRESSKVVATLPEVIAFMEASNKPIVAAIHGTALGGGLEIAMGCHYRIATKSARVGQPEVLIGILPGAGGTQRLPRLCGLGPALDLISTGRHIKAPQALKLGIIDKIVSDDILKEGIAFAKAVIDKPLNGRRISTLPVKDAENAEQLISAANASVRKRQRGMMAPIWNIKAVAESIKLPFDEAMEKEAEYFTVLVTSSQARALQYAFFSERLAPKWEVPGVASYNTVKPMNIKTAAVIGAGTMGTGIAMALLNARIPVTLVEQNKQFLEKGVKMIQDLYAGSVRLGKLTADQAKYLLSNLKTSLSYDDLSTVDCVIEAVYENMALKKEIFAKLDNACKPSAVLCSNTSSLDIDEIASATKRPDKVIGTHFFVPAYYMRLLENVRGKLTSPETIATVQSLGVRIGKIPVVVGNCDSFVGNRMLGTYTSEAQFLLEEGALPHEVDSVIKDFGIPIGAFEVSDLSGLDIGWRIRKERYEKLEKSGKKHDPNARFINGERFSPLGDTLCEKGRFGRKTGMGWYRYEKPGAKEPFIDAEITTLLEDYSKKHNITRRKISPQEIFERCFYPLINEGFKVLEDGIATRPEDIDVIWINGYGWPKYTGGPMYYANQIGLDKIYDTMCYYYEQHPTSSHWRPSALLRDLAKQQLPISQWGKQVASRL
ncbi:unnamed protein product [Owenia fusiformis]|uniref:Peroxisomal bifunctional enzyme n=1 Tax=Owenia fusiformis TaxID=6347 RepID=A0A8J1UVU9_OWEFU|nr:unnamed protein product [Owenia fusiformis]